MLKVHTVCRMQRTLTRRGAIAAAGAALALVFGAGGAAASSPSVPQHVKVTYTVNVFRTENRGRDVSALLNANAILQVNAQVLRAGTVLAKTTKVVAAGSHDVVVMIPASVAAGRATLVLKFTDELRRTQSFSVGIRIPTRAPPSTG